MSDHKRRKKSNRKDMTLEGKVEKKKTQIKARKKKRKGKVLSKLMNYS